MTIFATIEFRGEESLWAKLAAASAPFGSLDFGDPTSAALIAAAIPAYRESGNPAGLNRALTQVAVTSGADSDTVADTVADPCDVLNIVILRPPTSGVEIKIRNDGLVWVEFDPPSQERANQIIIRAAEMNVSVSVSPEHGRHLQATQPWSDGYERIALVMRELREARHAARVAAELVASAEDALHRAQMSASAQEEIGLPPVECAAQE